MLRCIPLLKTFVRCRGDFETLGWATGKSGYFLQFGLRLACLVESPLTDISHRDHSGAVKLRYPLNFKAPIIHETAYSENKIPSRIYLAMVVLFAYLV